MLSKQAFLKALVNSSGPSTKTVLKQLTILQTPSRLFSSDEETYSGSMGNPRKYERTERPFEIRKDDGGRRNDRGERSYDSSRPPRDGNRSNYRKDGDSSSYQRRDGGDRGGDRQSSQRYSSGGRGGDYAKTHDFNGGDRSGGDRRGSNLHFEAMNFKSRKHSMTTLTFEEVQDKTFLKDLHEQTR